MKSPAAMPWLINKPAKSQKSSIEILNPFLVIKWVVNHYNATAKAGTYLSVLITHKSPGKCIQKNGLAPNAYSLRTSE